MLAKSSNPRLSYRNLNVWPNDLEHISRVALRFGIICTKSELGHGQPIHSWLITFLLLIRYVTLWSRPLPPWPWAFVVHRVFCDQTLNLSEMEQSAAELLMIYQVCASGFSSGFEFFSTPTHTINSDGRATNWTEFGVDITHSSTCKIIVLDFTYIAPFQNESCDNASGGREPRLLLHLTAVGHLGCYEKWIFNLRDLIVHQSAC